MNERDISEKVLVSLRGGLPGAFVCKHNDMGTKGIPDIQVALADRTSWAELKHLKRGQTLKEINKAEQLIMCHQLATVNNGRCWVCVFEEPDFVTIWQPHVLFRRIWPNVAGPNPTNPKWKKVGAEPLVLESLQGTVHRLGYLLSSFGALRAPWSYDVVTLLVKDALRG